MTGQGNRVLQRWTLEHGWFVRTSLFLYLSGMKTENSYGFQKSFYYLE